jgi:hypothetical protein
MGSIADCFDNALIESFWSRMQVELLNRKRWNTRIELANAMLEGDAQRSACEARAHDRSGAARFAVVARQRELTTQVHAAASPAGPAHLIKLLTRLSVTFVQNSGRSDPTRTEEPPGR